MKKIHNELNYQQLLYYVRTLIHLHNWKTKKWRDYEKKCSHSENNLSVVLVTAKMKKIVNHFHQSAIIMGLLWSNRMPTYYIVEKLLLLYKSITVVLLEQKSTIQTLNLENVAFFEDFVKCLVPFRIAARKISGEKYATSYH